MGIREKIKEKRLYFDGGMGTLLIEKGLMPGELPETWNITRPNDIISIHMDYIRSGADIITANTFGANSLKFSDPEEIITAAICNAKKAVAAFDGEKYVAYDVGPLGRLLKPLGDLDFEDAVSVFARGMVAAQKAGADLILIETMNDAYETKAAVLAAKENTSLPVFVTNAYDASGKLMTGATPEAMVALLEGLRVDALGINCSLGPEQMLPVVKELIEYSSIPVIVNPNAGLPKEENGRTVYDVDANRFSDVMVRIADMGACILGGCCGTTPEYIRMTVRKTKDIPFIFPQPKNDTLVSSYTHAVAIGQKPVIIGERINPTGKPKFKDALRQNDIDYILREGIAEEEHGAHILDVNVGLPEIDEVNMMTRVVTALQSVTSLPLQIDTVDPEALEKALRLYNGKALINSVNGKEESLEAVLPLAAKYGGVLIALTLDEKGVPETAEGRLAIAEKIVKRAEKYGISKKNIIADPLAMTVSANPQSANVTLEAIKLIKSKLGIGVSLGVSNISFGLPQRDFLNAAFFTMALSYGLDCAIINPLSTEMMKSYHTFLALTAQDKMCEEYIDFASNVVSESKFTKSQVVGKNDADFSDLTKSIKKGLCDAAQRDAEKLLETLDGLDVINGYIVPALDEVGKGFENKTVFLPQLLMSAEAAKAAFSVIQGKMQNRSEAGKGKIVLATVKGDIHDIGKNIVKVLLENYGFDVIDLGKDVPPLTVVEAVKKSSAALVGLSALMTTTVHAMEETIALLRKDCPGVKVVVGGAVLTQEYADMIGADFYSKDAMQTVRYAEMFYGSNKRDKDN